MTGLSFRKVRPVCRLIGNDHGHVHHIHPGKTLKEWAFGGYSTGWGRRVYLRQSGAIHRCAVGQPSSSSMAQAIMSLPPTNLIISLHLKRVQLKILLWKAADQIFSNSPGKPTPSVFSALTVCPCRQCRTLCRSGWIVCVGSKDCMRGLKSSCEHMVPPHSAHVAFTYRTIPSHFSIWMTRSPCRSQCNAQ